MMQILYVSGASRPMTDADIEDILTTAKYNNKLDDITGVLLWADGMFIQILEGKTDKVRALVARIAGDPRHRNFMVVLERSTDVRLCSEWSMGFKRLELDRVADKSLFQISRAALEKRISRADGGLLLDAVVAFSHDFLPARNQG